MSRTCRSRLGDRTGEIDARMWDNAAEVMDTFERDDFLKVRGLLQVHQGRLQLTVHKLLKQPLESVDQTDFFPASARDPEEMFAELRRIVAAHEQSALARAARGISRRSGDRAAI